MALNLSTLTNPATSGGILAEALTTADFLDPVPILKNLSRGSNKGGDAKQTTALNQPKALPLIDGDGYLYVSGIAGNYAEVNAPILPTTGDFDLSIDFIFKGPVPNDRVDLFSQYDGSAGRFIMSVTSDNKLRVFWGPVGTKEGGVIVEGQRHTARLVRENADFTLSLDGTSISTWTSSAAITILINSLIGFGNLTNDRFFKGAVLSVTEGSNVNCDFTATNVRHGDTKFKCATGQVVTINQSGNDPATIIKKSVLRFDGADDGFKGLFNQTINGGYFFAAFSVLGDGGDNYGRVFTVNPTGGNDYSGGGLIFASRQLNEETLRSYFNANQILNHSDIFDDESGDFLVQTKITSGSQSSFVNNANPQTASITGTILSEEFNIGHNEDNSRSGGENASIDLEYLALFPATITDAEANRVRDFINTRNNVFLRHDTDGYYFFDPLSLAADAPVASWNGQIVGSDNDANLTITQSTANSQPDRLAPDKDGMVVRFNDSNDHLIVPSGFVEPAAGSWQVVGTSLGTFAYRVDNDAVTELTLLGNANTGATPYRQAGDLYGIILLPESATGADIEAARKLLIDRGAADGVSVTSLNSHFRVRRDIVEFGFVDTSGVTNFSYVWPQCSSMLSFPSIDTSNGTNFSQAWIQCGLQSFPPLDMRNGTNFNYAWQYCSALTSFPAGAKLGTSAQNVNFSSAWQQSGLTSFSTPLPTATSAAGSWANCTSLTSFNTELPSVTNASSAWYGCSSLESFSSELPLGRYLGNAWYNCSSLTDFSADVFSNWNPSSIYNGVFDGTWVNCSLTAQSVENILTSIDASGKYATTTGASGGSALTDAGIDIDYNVATGSLSAATNAAVTSLKSKGWSIIVNNVTL